MEYAMQEKTPEEGFRSPSSGLLLQTVKEGLRPLFEISPEIAHLGGGCSNRPTLYIFKTGGRNGRVRRQSQFHISPRRL